MANDDMPRCGDTLAYCAHITPPTSGPVSGHLFSLLCDTTIAFEGELPVKVEWIIMCSTCFVEHGEHVLVSLREGKLPLGGAIKIPDGSTSTFRPHKAS